MPMVNISFGGGTHPHPVFFATRHTGTRTREPVSMRDKA